MSGIGDWLEDHKKEALGVAALAGLGAATGGFGLLGGAAAGAGGAAAGAGALEGMALGAAGTGELGLLGGAGLAQGAALEGMSTGALEAPTLAMRLGKGAKLAGRGMATAQRAGLLGQPQQPLPQARAPGQAAPIASSVPSFAETYPVNVIDPEKRRRRMYG